MRSSWMVLCCGTLGVLACRKPSPPPPAPAPGLADAGGVRLGRSDGGGPMLTGSGHAAADAHTDAATDAAPGNGLTLRVVNSGQQPMTILTNPDTNELIHTRKLRSRPLPDASTPAGIMGDLVKFFPVGQMPLCSADGGAGYGGLGQPERRTLAPGEAMTFVWDGKLRREVLDRARGVCAEETAPDPGRYRFEFDQPYNPPGCNRPVITLPLAPDAPREIEIRCFTRRPAAHAAEE